MDKLNESMDTTTPMLAGALGAMFPFVAGAFAEPGIEYGTYAWNERLDSSPQDNELVFDPYDADQLREILANRTDAFEDGVLDPDVIPKVAALSAKEHGDARKAIDTLYEAGRLAEKNGTDTVTVDHVDDAGSERRRTGSRNP